MPSFFFCFFFLVAASTSLDLNTSLPWNEDAASISPVWSVDIISMQDFAKTYKYANGTNQSLAPPTTVLNAIGFVRMAGLRKGELLRVPSLIDNTPARNFSTSVAQHLRQMPVEELPVLAQVSHNHPLYKAFIRSYTGYCGSTTTTAAETRECFSERNAMLNFVKDLSPVQQPSVYPTHNLVMKIESVQQLPPLQMACHYVVFPSSIYSCHRVSGTVAFNVTGALTTGGTLDAILSCHTDTSSFDPASPPFIALGIKPGQDFCHFYAEHDILLV